MAAIADLSDLHVDGQDVPRSAVDALVPCSGSVMPASQLQVLDPVVRSVSVDMVDLLAPGQCSPKPLRHHKSVFGHVSNAVAHRGIRAVHAGPNQHVPLVVDRASATPEAPFVPVDSELEQQGLYDRPVRDVQIPADVGGTGAFSPQAGYLARLVSGQAPFLGLLAHRQAMSHDRFRGGAGRASEMSGYGVPAHSSGIQTSRFTLLCRRQLCGGHRWEV